MNFDLLWAVWATAAFLTFLVLELVGLRSAGGTFSDALRRWFGIEPVRPWRAGAIALFITGLAVFGSHIALGWP